MTSGAGAMVATAMRVVNAVPYVVAAATRPAEFGGPAVDDSRRARSSAVRTLVASVNLPELTRNPLEELTLEQLREPHQHEVARAPRPMSCRCGSPRWTSALAPTVADAIHRAVDIGDTGYPYGKGYAEAVSEFASQRWQWHDLAVSRTGGRSRRHARCRRDVASGHRPR